MTGGLVGGVMGGVMGGVGVVQAVPPFHAVIRSFGKTAFGYLGSGAVMPSCLTPVPYRSIWPKHGGVWLLTSSVAFGCFLSSVVVSQPRKVWVPEVDQLGPSVLYEASDTLYSHPSAGVSVRRTTNFVYGWPTRPACDQVLPPSVEYSTPTDEHWPEGLACAEVAKARGVAMAIPAIASAGSVLRRGRCTEGCSLETWCVLFVRRPTRRFEPELATTASDRQTVHD